MSSGPRHISILQPGSQKWVVRPLPLSSRCRDPTRSCEFPTTLGFDDSALTKTAHTPHGSPGLLSGESGTEFHRAQARRCNCNLDTSTDRAHTDLRAGILVSRAQRASEPAGASFYSEAVLRCQLLQQRPPTSDLLTLGCSPRTLRGDASRRTGHVDGRSRVAAIGDDLGMPTTGLQWIVSACILGFGAFLLLGGRAGDLLGRRQLFLAPSRSSRHARCSADWSTPTRCSSPAASSGVSAPPSPPPPVCRSSPRPSPKAPCATAPCRSTPCARSPDSPSVSYFRRARGELATDDAHARMHRRHHGGRRADPAAQERGHSGGYDIAGAVLGPGSMLLLVFTVVDAPDVGWTSPCSQSPLTESPPC